MAEKNIKERNVSVLGVEKLMEYVWTMIAVAGVQHVKDQ